MMWLVYLSGLKSWEIVLGYYDEIIDVFQLGMLLGGLVCGLDLVEQDDLCFFVWYCYNLFELYDKLFFIIVSVIVEMIELN